VRYIDAVYWSSLIDGYVHNECFIMNVSRLLAKKELRGGADAGPIMGSKIQTQTNFVRFFGGFKGVRGPDEGVVG
jgi:hypothetical protein